VLSSRRHERLTPPNFRRFYDLLDDASWGIVFRSRNTRCLEIPLGNHLLKTKNIGSSILHLAH
jgi:hypothetical protein